MEAASKAVALSPFEQLRYARDVVRVEGRALLQISERLGHEVCDAVACILQCRGNVIVTGMGKAGLIGQKIAATFGSTGTSSHFLHPGEAIHGDLGRIHREDIVLAFSLSGETEELTRLLPSLAEMQIPVIAVTGKPHSRLARAALVTLDLGPLEEACSLGLAPSTSTTAMLAVGDALALVLSRMRNFAAEDFARFHPGGSLGRKLAKVEDVMRPLLECRVAHDDETLREVLIHAARPGRRSGAIMLTDAEGRLTGLFTDSDLARLLERDARSDLDIPIRSAMTSGPRTVAAGSPLSAAVTMLAESKISELPVVDADTRPLGLIDITDVVGLLPDPAASTHLEQSGPSASDSARETVPFANKPLESHRR